MHLQLVSDWRRLPAGHVMRDYPDGAGEILIRKGVARVYAEQRTNAGDSNAASQRTVDNDGGKVAPKPIKQRHST